MLVLTRKSNQSIMIGDNIEVSVLAIMGEKVRIGIQADRSVPVFRKEVYLEIQAERGNEAADDASTEAIADAQPEVEPPARDGASSPSSGGEPVQDGASDAPSSVSDSAHGDGAQNGRREVDAALRSINGDAQ